MDAVAALKRTLLGRPGPEKHRYLGGVAAFSVVLFAVSYLFLYEGWWNGAMTPLLLGSMLVLSAFAGYRQYGLAFGIAGSWLPLSAVILRGEFIGTTMEGGTAPVSPVQLATTMLTLTTLFGVLFGLVGYALGAGLRFLENRLRSTPAAT